MRLYKREYSICCNTTEFLSRAARAQSTKITPHGEGCFMAQMMRNASLHNSFYKTASLDYTIENWMPQILLLFAGQN